MATDARAVKRRWQAQLDGDVEALLAMALRLGYGVQCTLWMQDDGRLRFPKLVMVKPGYEEETVDNIK